MQERKGQRHKRLARELGAMTLGAVLAVIAMIFLQSGVDLGPTLRRVPRKEEKR